MKEIKLSTKLLLEFNRKGDSIEDLRIGVSFFSNNGQERFVQQIKLLTKFLNKFDGKKEQVSEMASGLE